MKILVVDDEPQMQPLFEQQFRRELRNGEIHLSFAGSGEEALAILPDSGVVLILSDINMPGMSGLELLRRIREIHPHRPPTVVMVTAYGDENNRQQADRNGADDFLTKPIDFRHLKNKMAEFTEVSQPPGS
jgi:two-component system, chemotaxis family, chemotaxis protein CheY